MTEIPAKLNVSTENDDSISINDMINLLTQLKESGYGDDILYFRDSMTGEVLFPAYPIIVKECYFDGHNGDFLCHRMSLEVKVQRFD